jgi:hypothetical protein
MHTNLICGVGRIGYLRETAKKILGLAVSAWDALFNKNRKNIIIHFCYFCGII